MRTEYPPKATVDARHQDGKRRMNANVLLRASLPCSSHGSDEQPPRGGSLPPVVHDPQNDVQARIFLQPLARGRICRTQGELDSLIGYRCQFLDAMNQRSPIHKLDAMIV